MSHLLVRGNAVHIPLADESVHCVVCSPPYWGLRDYGTAQWEGGEAGCDHTRLGNRHERPRSGLTGGLLTVNHAQEPAYRTICGKCGARRVDRQLGLEATPEAYIAAMVRVFREVRRVLRSDGTAWVNMGDSYNSSPSNQQDGDWMIAKSGAAYAKYGTIGRQHRDVPGLKPKDLVGIPWRLALALQADGWWLRSEIIWAKPNPMPESVTDRPTKSHEQVFLLSKSERYYYDGQAVREGALNTGGNGRGHGQIKMGDARRDPESRTDCPRSEWVGSSRNLRSVLTIPTEAYPGAHFATFPRKLVEPCIRAGTSERGVCPRCGAPWERVVDVERWSDRERRRGTARGWQGLPGRESESGQNGIHNLNGQTSGRLVSTLGWQATCSHGLEPVPAVVLDPFIGSGTTLVVAEALGRRGIGLDLKAAYLQLARRRINRPHAPVPRPARAEEFALPFGED